MRLRRSSPAAAARRRPPAARRSPTTAGGSDGEGVAWRRRSTRWRSSPSGSAGTDVHVANLTQPGNEPHDLELTIKADRRGRGRRPGAARARLPAGRRRRGRRGRRRATCSTSPRSSSSTGRGRRGLRDDRGRPRHDDDATRTSGRTRCGWPTLADAVADALAEVDPDHADDLPTPTPQALRADLDDARRGVRRRGCSGCERDTVVVTPRRVRLPRAGTGCTSRRSPASPPTPSRRRPTWPGCSS